MSRPAASVRPPLSPGCRRRIDFARSREGGREAGTKGGTDPRTVSAPVRSSRGGRDQLATNRIGGSFTIGNPLIDQQGATRDAREMGRRVVPPRTAGPVEMGK